MIAVVANIGQRRDHVLRNFPLYRKAPLLITGEEDFMLNADDGRTTESSVCGCADTCVAATGRECRIERVIRNGRNGVTAGGQSRVDGDVVTVGRAQNSKPVYARRVCYQVAHDLRRKIVGEHAEATTDCGLGIR